MSEVLNIGSRSDDWWARRLSNFSADLFFIDGERMASVEGFIQSKFEQNKSAMDALVATDGMTLTHDLGHLDLPNSSLPAIVFCDILTS